MSGVTFHSSRNKGLINDLHKIAGTGKTATVREVMRQLNAMVEDGDLPKFDFIEINGMRLTEPSQAYVHIW